MNILYLNNSVHLGGDTKCILKLCKEFKDTNKIFIASNGGVLLNQFQYAGAKGYYIRNVENKFPHNILLNVMILMKVVKTEKIDIIHSHHRMTTLLAKIVSKFTGVKVIHTQHSCIEDKFKLTKLALNSIKVITVSETAKSILTEKCGLNKKNITTIYNTIETECKNKKVDSRLIDLKNNGYFIVAQISRIVDYKGVYDFVKVAKQTTKENNKIKFVLIGDGPELNNIRDLAKKEGLENKIYLLGAKDNIIEHLKYIDLLLLCSYIEGLPLTPLEAFSQGIPVIGTNIGGTNEEIIDGVNGYLVEIKDIKAFSNRILQLYKDKNLYNSLKDNAYRIFNHKFNNFKYVDQHNKIYNNLV